MTSSSLLQPIYNWIKKRQTSNDVSKQDIKVESVWRDTGQVYYLLNTLKLSYESDYGPVCFERLNLDSLRKLLNELKQSDNPFLQQKISAEQKDAYVISLCGVTWEENEGCTRVKALSEAAMLRSKQHDFKRSQAVFKHEYFLEHNDILNAPSTTDKSGVFTYPNVSIEEFVKQLELSNSEISETLKRRINVQPSNFDSLFNPTEEAEIDRLLNMDIEHNEQLDKLKKPEELGETSLK